MLILNIKYEHMSRRWQWWVTIRVGLMIQNAIENVKAWLSVICSNAAVFYCLWYCFISHCSYEWLIMRWQRFKRSGLWTAAMATVLVVFMLTSLVLLVLHNAAIGNDQQIRDAFIIWKVILVKIVWPAFFL